MFSQGEMELVLKGLGRVLQCTIQLQEMTSEERVKDKGAEYNVFSKITVAGITRGFLGQKKVQILLSSGTAEYVIS